MEFTEMEKRLLYQTEGCERYAIINELSMASQYAGDPARRKAAKDLMEKLRPLSDAECMNLVRDIQKNYRLPKEGRTIGELIAEARQKSGAEKLKGHDIMALERFDPEDRERQNFLHFFYFFISHEQNHRESSRSWLIRGNQKRKGKAQSRRNRRYRQEIFVS